MAKNKDILLLGEGKEKQDHVEASEQHLIVPEIIPGLTYTVEIGYYESLLFSNIRVADLKFRGFTAITQQVDDNKYKVHCGIYSVKRNAENMVVRLQKFGYRPNLT
jgi:cell division protein FtsN